jgi:hypothetical protein
LVASCNLISQNLRISFGVTHLATAAEASAAISAAFETYAAELKQAGAVWDKKPAAAGEGEDAWSARQVAEHIAGAGPFFASGLAQALSIEGPALARIELPDAAGAIGETERTHGLLMGVVGQITDDNLAIEIDHPRLGKQTVEGILGILSHHLNDHANQLKTLRTS